MNAAVPPWAWMDAIACKASVVLPALSGPNISMTRPLGNPPPSATSSVSAPVEIVSTRSFCASPRRMIEPWPKLRSIWVSTFPNAFWRSVVVVAVADAVLL